MRKRLYSYVFGAICCLFLMYITIRFKDPFSLFDESFLNYGNLVLVSINILSFTFIPVKKINSTKFLPLNIILGTWILYSVIINLFNVSWLPYSTVLVESTFCILIYFLFYNITANGILTIDQILKYVLVILIVTSVIFVRNFFHINQLAQYNDQFTAENNIYYILLMTPWIFLLKRTFYKNLLLSLIFILVIISLKRTATFALAFSFIAYTFYEYKNAKTTKRVQLFLLISFASVFIYLILNEFFSSTTLYLLDRISSMNETGGSGRVEIWERTLNLQSKSNLYEYVFGHGHDMVIRRNSLYYSAHNDWIEILFDYGLVGLSLYAIFYFRLLVDLIKQNQFFLPFLISIIIFGTISMFSHLFIYPTYFFVLTAFWGTIYGTNKKLSSQSINKYD